MRSSAFLGAQKRLHNARSIIHLSVDAGTSPNNKPLIAIVAYYITEDRQLKKLLLSLKEIYGRHTGKNLVKYVMDAINE